jgi:hypothetical protein
MVKHSFGCSNGHCVKRHWRENDLSRVTTDDQRNTTRRPSQRIATVRAAHHNNLPVENRLEPYL